MFLSCLLVVMFLFEMSNINYKISFCAMTIENHFFKKLFALRSKNVNGSKFNWIKGETLELVGNFSDSELTCNDFVSRFETECAEFGFSLIDLRADAPNAADFKKKYFKRADRYILVKSGRGSSLEIDMEYPVVDWFLPEIFQFGLVSKSFHLSNLSFSLNFELSDLSAFALRTYLYSLEKKGSQNKLLYSPNGLFKNLMLVYY